MKYLFPELKGSSAFTITEQVDKIIDECWEAKYDIIWDNKDGAMLECVDVIHAAETLYRVMITKFGQAKVDKLVKDCIDKNSVRGYYE